MNRTKRKPLRESKSKRKTDPVLELKRLTIMQMEKESEAGYPTNGGCNGCYG